MDVVTVSRFVKRFPSSISIENEPQELEYTCKLLGAISCLIFAVSYHVSLRCCRGSKGGGGSTLRAGDNQRIDTTFTVVINRYCTVRSFTISQSIWEEGFGDVLHCVVVSYGRVAAIALCRSDRCLAATKVGPKVCRESHSGPLTLERVHRLLRHGHDGMVHTTACS